MKNLYKITFKLKPNYFSHEQHIILYVVSSDLVSATHYAQSIQEDQRYELESSKVKLTDILVAPIDYA